MRRLVLEPSSSPLNLLCLGAHADDIEIGCGGTVMRLLEEHPSAKVWWVVFSTTPARAREAKVAADVALRDAGETNVQLLGFEDSHFPSQLREIKDYFENLKSGFEPDLILTHSGEDAHQDHRTISDLTWNTFRDHLILEFEIPKYDGDLGRPGVFVPLTREQGEKKIDLLFDAFESQADKHWFDRDLFRGLLRIRGMECRAPEGYAEAFSCRKAVL